MNTCFVFVNTELGYELEVANYIKKVSGVIRVDHVLGGYDLIVQIQSENLQQIRDIITWKIRKIKFIRSTLTLVANGMEDEK